MRPELVKSLSGIGVRWRDRVERPDRPLETESPLGEELSSRLGGTCETAINLTAMPDWNVDPAHRPPKKRSDSGA